MIQFCIQTYWVLLSLITKDSQYTFLFLVIKRPVSRAFLLIIEMPKLSEGNDSKLKNAPNNFLGKK